MELGHLAIPDARQCRTREPDPKPVFSKESVMQDTRQELSRDVNELFLVEELEAKLAPESTVVILD